MYTDIISRTEMKHLSVNAFFSLIYEQADDMEMQDQDTVDVFIWEKDTSMRNGPRDYLIFGLGFVLELFERIVPDAEIPRPATWRWESDNHVIVWRMSDVH